MLLRRGRRLCYYMRIEQKRGVIGEEAVYKEPPFLKLQKSMFFLEGRNQERERRINEGEDFHFRVGAGGLGRESGKWEKRETWDLVIS